MEGTPDPVPSRFRGEETGGWVVLLEGRDPIPLTVSIKGDSLIAISGQYPSILRKDVMVTVRTAGVLQDGRLVGKLVATYDSPDGQEVVTGTFEACVGDLGSGEEAQVAGAEGLIPERRSPAGHEDESRGPEVPGDGGASDGCAAVGEDAGHDRGRTAQQQERRRNRGALPRPGRGGPRR